MVTELAILENVYCSEYADATNFRIPALYQTSQGTTIAGVDRRVNSGADSPNNIDSILRRSFTNGQTWESDSIFINNYPGNASNIDLSFVEEESSQKLFALVDGFPHDTGLMGGIGNNIDRGTGFSTIANQLYFTLYDNEDQSYTVRDDGIVYDKNNQPTPYTVKDHRILYKNDKKVDHVFSSASPLQAKQISYLELYTSQDEGKTWSSVQDLNAQVKEEWMLFLGTGPGNGIQIQQGPHEGRLVYPVYFFNQNNRQASAVIYSDDGGDTWHRGESPNEGRITPDGKQLDERTFSNREYELTESQVVEMPNGQLKMFSRNRSGYAQIATSYDGGVSWDNHIQTDMDLPAPYSQMSVINYSQPVQGKPAIIYSSASDHTQRVNGKVKVGLIEDRGFDNNGKKDYDINWVDEQLVKEGHYGYSSLTELADGTVGLLYEADANENIDFVRFSIETE
ncbi:exo-alpha-sialidase [uncultured Marinococcus sp.]|uniref:sialidase family protein n=1 Tax=uncultured Marinococcus sp. TaxID=487012 RepID=UPI00261F2A83|nr:sialidase family protein [uncultured Marinococcus sp.]